MSWTEAQYLEYERNSDTRNEFSDNRTIPTLTDYLLVAQTKMHIEHFTRQTDGRWLLTDFTQPQQVIALPAINCTMMLSDIYRKVTFGE